jgi:hypothetical protein
VGDAHDRKNLGAEEWHEGADEHRSSGLRGWMASNRGHLVVVSVVEAGVLVAVSTVERFSRWSRWWLEEVTQLEVI